MKIDLKENTFFPSLEVSVQQRGLPIKATPTANAY